jgi:putative heme-binding domain-containing protein
LLQSILDPNREVAPQFYTTVLELEDGEVFSGFLLRSSSQEVFRDARGQERTIQKHQIVRRKELTTSLMPGGLEAQLTAEELRDLLAYLLSSRGE